MWIGASALSGGTGAAIGGAIVAEVLQDTAGASMSNSLSYKFRLAVSAEPWIEESYRMLVRGTTSFRVLVLAALFSGLSFLAAKVSMWNYCAFLHPEEYQIQVIIPAF